MGGGRGVSSRNDGERVEQGVEERGKAARAAGTVSGKRSRGGERIISHGICRAVERTGVVTPRTSSLHSNVRMCSLCRTTRQCRLRSILFPQNKPRLPPGTTNVTAGKTRVAEGSLYYTAAGGGKAGVAGAGMGRFQQVRGSGESTDSRWRLQSVKVSGGAARGVDGWRSWAVRGMVGQLFRGAGGQQGGRISGHMH